MATSDVLSSDEVDALMESNPQTGRYDFTEPLISHIEQGQMYKILETLFIDELTSSLSQFLHIPVHVNDSDISISRYDKIVAEVKNNPRTYHALKLNPDGEHLLLTLSQPFVYQCIELLFGGNPNQKSTLEKPFGPIELNVANKIVNEIIHALCQAWSSIAVKQCEIEHSSHHPMRIPLCNSGERAVVTHYKISLRDVDTEFMLCMPMKLFDFKTQKESETEKLNTPEHLNWQKKLKENVLSSRIPLTVVLTESKVKLSRIRTLRTGDILPISKPRESKVYVENCLLFTGECGTQGDHNVVRLKQCCLDT